jgi:pilus assembly protein CpaB
MIDIKNIPGKFVPPGKTTSKAEVVGFIAAVSIRKDEPITLNKIIPPGVKTGLSKQVTPGRRAVAIQVDDYNAVNRLVKPGDRVDLVTTIDPPGGVKGSQITKLVLQDVAVLAVGEYITTIAPRKTERDEVTGKETVRNLNVERNFNTVTVETDPESALQLVMLRDVGARLTMLLRNNDDTDRVNVAGKTLFDILGPDAGKIMRGPAQK